MSNVERAEATLENYKAYLVNKGVSIIENGGDAEKIMRYSLDSLQEEIIRTIMRDYLQGGGVRG
ncbi:hypothetical protein [Ligilactobacillus equi]|uniref:Uncharacterized protein n=1 Tax=Ligilactobacillus equi DPC 6820 TaxID=1392007 RepID=V7HYE9_9LACO|nr:hypothetical protein [Ligilactobacillus equi]ETA74056.1 hypothetical protein LEQ_1516c [Ligilactobacillus equi DPC 6820]